MLNHISNIGIRRIGIFVCFNTHYEKFGRYPKSADELGRVTSTRLSPSSFKKYSDWFNGQRT